MGGRDSKKQGALTLKYTVIVSLSDSVILLFYSTELHEFVQGNTHIGHNHEACCCLDSKPTPNAGVRNSTTNPYDYYSSRHQAAGFANSAIDCNAVRGGSLRERRAQRCFGGQEIHSQENAPL